MMCQGWSAKHNHSEDNKLPSVKHIEEEETDVDSWNDDFAVWTISGDCKEATMLSYKSMVSLNIELDTDAAVSVISEQQWNQLFPIVLLEIYTGSPLQGYSGQLL